MATIKDIAAYTGVSPTTVSNVIHGRSAVFPKKLFIKFRMRLKS